MNSVSVQLVTHEFPFLWEEIHIPIPHRTDRARAEHILLDAAMEATRDVCDAAHRAMRVFHEKYGGVLEQPEPRVYLTRQIVRHLAEARIEIASATVEVTGVPLRQDGKHPLEQTSRALPWSGVAAGISMGFSIIAEGLLQVHLPHAAWTPLVAKFGYLAVSRRAGRFQSHHRWLDPALYVVFRGERPVLGWVAGFLIPTSIGMRLVAALAHVQHAPDE